MPAMDQDSVSNWISSLQQGKKFEYGAVFAGKNLLSLIIHKPFKEQAVKDAKNKLKGNKIVYGVCIGGTLCFKSKDAAKESPPIAKDKFKKFIKAETKKEQGEFVAIPEDQWDAITNNGQSLAGYLKNGAGSVTAEKESDTTAEDQPKKPPTDPDKLRELAPKFYVAKASKAFASLNKVAQVMAKLPDGAGEEASKTLLEMKKELESFEPTSEEDVDDLIKELKDSEVLEAVDSMFPDVRKGLISALEETKKGVFAKISQ